MIGTSLAHYRIVELVGSGGMGEVYRAEDLNLRRQVALKVLPRPLAEDPVARQRLLREARAASQLTHPNIATIYEAAEASGQLYLAMELVEGESLAKRLRAGPLPADEIVKIGSQVAGALEAAHRQGVVHRDIKPGNILIRPDGLVKVVDFGLAVHVTTTTPEDLTSSPTEEMRITRTGYSAGTVAYMSPEQAEGKDPEAGTDIFSLGVVLYEMATGRLPFHGSTPFAVAAAIVHEPPAPPGELRPDLPPALAEIILRCLNKEAGSRPDSADRIREALMMLSEGRTTQSVLETLGSRARVLGGHTVWLAVGLLALFAIVFWVFTSETDGSGPPIRDIEARRHFKQAQLYESRGYTPSNLESAETLYRRALDLEPDNPFLQARLANLLARFELEYPRAGRLEEIRGLTDRAVAAAPELDVAWVARGRLLLLEGDAEEAAAAARRAIEARKDSHSGYTLLGDALIALGRTEQGLAQLRRAVDVGEGHIQARSLLARRLNDAGRRDEAVVEYGKILEYDPNNISALNNLAAIYLYESRYLDSISLLRRLLDLQPDDDAAASNLGTAYFHLDRTEDAIAAYQEAVKRGPDYPLHKQNLADAYEKLGDDDRAAEWYGRALQDYDRKLAISAEGRKAAVRADRAYCAAKLGRIAEATRDLDAALRTHPDHWYFLYCAARVHAIAGNRARTFEFIGRAVDAGFPPEEILRDASFDAYRKEPEFLEILTATDRP